MSAAEERQNRIVELVSEKGNIQVERLAEILDVSRMTIRRDLNKLKQEGIIERRHGAANDIEVGFLLHRSNVELMICGGTVQKETGSIFGTFSNQMMSYIHVGIAFMGAMSIDSNFNVLTPTMDKASLKRMVTKNANRSYLVVDHSKFNRQALMKINSLQDYTGVVTTKVFDEKELERIQERDIHLIMVGDGTE